MPVYGYGHPHEAHSRYRQASRLRRPIEQFLGNFLAL